MLTLFWRLFGGVRLHQNSFCYGLDVVYPPQAHMFAWTFIGSCCCWRGCGTFKRWLWLEEEGHLGHFFSFPLPSSSCPSLPSFSFPTFSSFYLCPRHKHKLFLFSSLPNCEEVSYPGCWGCIVGNLFHPAGFRRATISIVFKMSANDCRIPWPLWRIAPI